MHNSNRIRYSYSEFYGDGGPYMVEKWLRNIYLRFHNIFFLARKINVPIFTVKSSALYKSFRYFSPEKWQEKRTKWNERTSEQQTEWKHAHFSLKPRHQQAQEGRRVKLSNATFHTTTTTTMTTTTTALSNNNNNKQTLLLVGVSGPIPHIRYPTLTYANTKMCWKKKRNANERWMKLFTCASVDSVIFFFFFVHSPVHPPFFFLLLLFACATVVHLFYSIGMPFLFAMYTRSFVFFLYIYFLALFVLHAFTHTTHHQHQQQ